MLEAAAIILAAIAGGLGGSTIGLHLMAPHTSPEDLESTKEILRNVGLGFIADTV